MGNTTPVIEQRDTIVLPEAIEGDDYITSVNALKNGKIAVVQQSGYLSIVNMKQYTVEYREKHFEKKNEEEFILILYEFKNQSLLLGTNNGNLYLLQYKEGGYYNVIECYEDNHYLENIQQYSEDTLITIYWSKIMFWNVHDQIDLSGPKKTVDLFLSENSFRSRCLMKNAEHIFVELRETDAFLTEWIIISLEPFEIITKMYERCRYRYDCLVQVEEYKLLSTDEEGVFVFNVRTCQKEWKTYSWEHQFSEPIFLRLSDEFVFAKVNLKKEHHYLIDIKAKSAHEISLNEIFIIGMVKIDEFNFCTYSHESITLWKF